jgi:hypothetical protein
MLSSPRGYRKPQAVSQSRCANPEEIGFLYVTIGAAVDTFQGPGGERNARRFEVYGYPFFARKL